MQEDLNFLKKIAGTGKKVSLSIVTGRNRRTTTTKKGIVVGIYDHYFLVHTGKYKECFSYADLRTGRVSIELA